MYLETERLILRNFQAKDAEDLYNYLSNPAIYTFEPGNPIDLKTAKEAVERRSKDDLFIAVEDKKNQKLIGHLYFAKDGYEAIQTWHLGYIFNPDFQNKGFCTEACQAIVSYAFNTLKAHRIDAKCSTENTASNRVLQKLGFRLEGTMLKNVFFHRDSDGAPIWFDSNIYAVLSDEWK